MLLPLLNNTLAKQNKLVIQLLIILLLLLIHIALKLLIY